MRLRDTESELEHGDDLAVLRRLNHRVTGRHLDRRSQRAVEGTPHRIHPVYAFDRLSRRFRGRDRQVDVNAPDDQHVVLSFHFADDVGLQPAAACVNLARFQRASKGAHHSTGRGGDDIVDRGGVRFAERCRIDFVVLGNRSMHAEWHRVDFARKARDPQGPFHSFNRHTRCVDHVRHDGAFIAALLVLDQAA